MSAEAVKVNVLRDGCVKAECHRTFRQSKNGGTWGAKGDVRRCEHGRLWIYVGSERLTIDVWRRLTLGERIRHRRAVRDLPTAADDGAHGEGL